MTALLALIRKDLILYLGDRRALMMNLLMPIVLGAFFGYLFGGSGARDNARLEIAVVNQDSSETARRIVAGLQGDTALSVLSLPLEEARARVLKGKLQAAAVIPAGFGEAAGSAFFGGKTKPEITLYYDPSQSAVLAMVKGMLTQQVMQQVSAEMMGGQGSAKVINDMLAQLEKADPNDAKAAPLREFMQSLKKFQEREPAATAPAATGSAAGASSAPHGGLSMPFVTKDQPMSSGPKYNGYAHAFAGMAVQFIMFMGIDAGIGILLARRMGLWNRLLASPITINTVLLARALSSAIIAFVLVLFIFAAAMLLFQVRISGSLTGFLAVALAFSLVTATFGLLIAAFGKTPEAARGIAIFATLIMVMLGGAWVPAFLFPQWLQSATLAVPTRWAVDGLDAMTWRGLGLDAAWPMVLAQLGFAALFGLLAMWKFGRESAPGRA